MKFHGLTTGTKKVVESVSRKCAVILIAVVVKNHCADMVQCPPLRVEYWISGNLSLLTFCGEAADTGVSKLSESANPNSIDRNHFVASVLRLYFPVPPSANIGIASQPDRKNPIHNPTRLCLNFQPYRV